MNYFNQESDRLVYRKLTIGDVGSWSEFFADNDRLSYLGIDLSKMPANWPQNGLINS